MSRRGHHEGSIYQRSSDGKWLAVISVKEPSGRTRRITRVRRTRQEATRALRQLQRQVEDGHQLTNGDSAVAVYLNGWLESSAKPSVRPKTYQGYRSICDSRIIPRIGGLKLSKLTPAAVQALYSDLAADGLAPRSIINTHRVLHRALNQAMKWGLVIRNVCDAVDVPRVPKSEMQTLTRDETERFMEFTADHRLHALYVLAFTTGMRLGELLGLQWGDVDLDRSRLHIRRALQFVSGQGHVFTEPKTARSRRTIILSKRAVAALRQHRRRQNEERLLLGSEWEMPELVFANHTGRPLNPGNVSNGFKQALTRANLPVIRFHDTRHTAATLLLLQGIHPKIVADMLGHSTIALTLDTYSHVIPVMHEEAARAMDAMFGS